MSFSVKEHLDKIVEYFDPEKAGDNALTVVYVLHDSGENDGVWTVSIADGKIALTEGEAEHYDTKMRMTAEVYERIVKGWLDITRLAYLTGAVRYYGRSLGQQELQRYLTIPAGLGISVL